MTDEEAVVQAKKIITSVSGMLDQEVAVVQPKRSTSGTVDREEAVVQPKHSVTSTSGKVDREVAVVQPKHSVTSISGTVDREVAVVQPKHSVTSISGTVDREVAVFQPKHSLTSTSGKVDREVAVIQPNNSLTSTSGTMDREVAVVQPKHSIASASSDVVPSPVASIPVSMVVHGGTGVLHGNMTSLTVNQYIGMVPERGRGAWDSSMVRELVADAVKISADANAQLFHPSDSVSKPVHSGLHETLTKATRTRGCWMLLAVLIIASIVILVSTSLYINSRVICPQVFTRHSLKQQERGAAGCCWLC